MPGLQHAHLVPWAQFLLLAALYLVCRLLPRCRLFGGRLPAEQGLFTAVLLLGVFTLPAPAAVLLPLPGTLLAGPVPGGRARTALALAASSAAATCAFRVLNGGASLPAAGLGPSLPAAVAALAAFWITLGLLGRGLTGMPGLTGLPGLTSLPRIARPPLDAHQVSQGVLGILAAALCNGPGGIAAALLVLVPGYVSCVVLARSRQVAAARHSTVRALVEAVELKDGYTRGHSERVGRAAAMIADELGLDPERTEALRTAGMLHDIGKLGVPTPTLRKEGALDQEEWREIRRHPEHGHEIVRGLPLLPEARDAILHHHERLDGTGYPAGLAGGRIPEAARLVAVADAFDAMTSTRSYRLARPVSAAVAELRRCAGTQFDPRMVRALTRALDRHGWPYPEQAHHPDSSAARGPRSGNVPAAAERGRGQVQGADEGGTEGTGGRP